MSVIILLTCTERELTISVGGVGNYTCAVVIIELTSLHV